MPISSIFDHLFNGGKLQVCFTLSSMLVSPSSSFDFIPGSQNAVGCHGCPCFVQYTLSRFQEGPSVLHSTADRTPAEDEDVEVA